MTRPRRTSMGSLPPRLATPPAAAPARPATGNPREPAVALLGNPSEGWAVVGPYGTRDDAAEAHPGPDTWIMPLRAPAVTGICANCGEPAHVYWCPKPAGIPAAKWRRMSHGARDNAEEAARLGGLRRKP